MSQNLAIRIMHKKRTAVKTDISYLSLENTEDVRALHASVPEYKATSLIKLEDLAKEWGVKAIFVKDESTRFGLKAFKGLGGIYALARIIGKKLNIPQAELTLEKLLSPEIKAQVANMEFVTTTDGNHGKGVAWAAAKLGCRSHVYLPVGSSPFRAEAIREAGATEVRITDLKYDDAVRYAAARAEEKGWTLVQDTSFAGYEAIPRDIVRGYTTMAWETGEQLKEYGLTPTHVFLQAGVGAMAGGVAGFLADYYKESIPDITVVEPTEVACILASAEHGDGEPHCAEGNGTTIMAGLNCGEPCTLTWPILEALPQHYLACPDYVAARGMRIYAAPLGKDTRIISGESGASTMGALSMLLGKKQYSEERARMGLDANAVILLFNTEGDTDPQAYKNIIHDGQYPVPDNQL